jgi:hypothetical protein
MPYFIVLEKSHKHLPLGAVKYVKILGLGDTTAPHHGDKTLRPSIYFNCVGTKVILFATWLISKFDSFGASILLSKTKTNFCIETNHVAINFI